MALRPPWEIRLYRDGAQFYLVRALAELEARQLLDGEALPKGFQQLREIMAALAMARSHYASYLMECLDSPEIFTYSAWVERQNPA